MFKHNWAWIKLATYNSSTVLTRNLQNPRDYAPLIRIDSRSKPHSYKLALKLLSAFIDFHVLSESYHS